MQFFSGLDRWRTPVKNHLLATLMASLVVCGCTPSAEPSARSLDDTYRIDLTPQTQPSLPPRGEAIIIYLIQDSQLVARPRVAPDPLSLMGILSILATGPTERELRLEMRTAIGETVFDFEMVVLNDRTITVEISESFGELPGDEQSLLVGQLVLTLAENFSIDGVVFNLNGNPTPILGPTGEVLERAVTATDFRSAVALN